MLYRLLLSLVAVYILGAGVWVIQAGRARNESLLNVSYDPTRELWREMNQEFIADYERRNGVKLRIRQSHGGSSSQARAVIDGLPADVVTLALWNDTDAVRKAGLIDDGWEERLNGGLPYSSTIVFVVRKGNPRNIRDWTDLSRDDVKVITPNPKTSGNGKLSMIAMFGWAVRGGKMNEDDAKRYIGKVFKNVPVLDQGARGATMTFAQKKIGDVHLTWENEAYLEVQEANGELEIVYPSESVKAEPYVAVVDTVVRRKGTSDTAYEYMKFLFSDAGQMVIAKHYYRPANKDIPTPLPPFKMFTVKDLKTNWNDINNRFFAEGGLFDQIYAGGQ